MYNPYETYPYWPDMPRYSPDIMYNAYNPYVCPYYSPAPMYNWDFSNQFNEQYTPQSNAVAGYGFSPVNPSNYQLPNKKAPKNNVMGIRDYGPEPFVINIEEATKRNNTFRTALWTGTYLQLTLMSIGVGEDIGLELHPDLDQFIRIEEGDGIVMMGDIKDNLDFQRRVSDDFIFIIPAGKWHNLINTGNKPIKLYSIYAPPQHPHGTVHVTKAEAEAAEEHHE